MSSKLGILLICGNVLSNCLFLCTNALQINKTYHRNYNNRDSDISLRSSSNTMNVHHRFLSRSSMQSRNRNSVPRYPSDQETERDEDLFTTYDNPNFTSFMYEDNPPIYPNPEVIYDGEAKSTAPQWNRHPVVDVLSDVDVPDSSLADADLKDHNIIDSYTYLYGMTGNTNAPRSQWLSLVLVTKALAGLVAGSTAVWLLLGEPPRSFRRRSRLYPIQINFLCCLVACDFIYIIGVLDTSSSYRCEMVALLLHYAHLVCAAWLLVICCCITDFAVRSAVMDLRYNYLFAYGIPAVMVMFFYALSVEHYETKHYCWMSLEKGMLIGFMLPVTLMIVVTTALVLFGLQSITKKQNEMVASKIHNYINQQNNIQERIDSTEIIIGRSKRYGSADTDVATTSNERCCSESAVTEPTCTGSSTEQGLEQYHVDENVGCRVAVGDDKKSDEQDELLKYQSIKLELMNLSIDNLSWRSEGLEGVAELKSYLQFSLVMQPLYAVCWLIGVVALENSHHWLSPTLFLTLCLAMYIYVSIQCVRVQPIIRSQADELASCCDDIVSEATCVTQRSTDSIPLLVSGGGQPAVVVPDTISTISI